MNYQIELMKPNDWQDVQTIHAEGIATGIASFAERVPEWKTWDATYLAIGRFVARGAAGVLGWAALSSVSSH